VRCCCPMSYRPVRRAVQRELETNLAKALLKGDFVEEDSIVVEANERGLVFTKGVKSAVLA
jgi:ATP-dependent Clp protease ATP-binding subunit ClpB